MDLPAERDHAARMAEKFAMGMLDGHDCACDLRFWADMKDALDRQIAWVNRRTAWASPATPAWTD
jgi:hypothetical protein